MRSGYVLVTGGAGFIGSHLVERLLKAGESVVVIDDFSTGTPVNLAACVDHPGLTLRRGRVSSVPDLSGLAAGAKYIFHLAASVGVELVVKSPIYTIENNLRETEAILAAAVPSRTPLLLASTSEVYGKSSKEEFSEEDDLLIGSPTVGRWSYACSKLTDEFLAMAYMRERHVPVTVVRLFNTVGPRQTGKYGMVLPRFVHAALRHEPLRVYGDGTQTRCFCAVQDTVEALTRLAVCSQAVGEIINVGTRQVVSIAQLAQTVIEALDSRSTLEFVPYEAAIGPGFADFMRRKPALAKLERLVGFVPATPLAAIIAGLAGKG
jgi:UDP-glucose 4-epimerase